MEPNFSSQFAGTAHGEVIALMERARHVTPYMVVSDHQGNPVWLFPARPRDTRHVLQAWDQERGWHERSEVFMHTSPQYGKGYPLPDDLVHGIRVYADTPGFRRARQGVK